MSNTKVCPACQKSLPVLAVRCKFCGFKQPLKNSDDGNDAVDDSLPEDDRKSQDIAGDSLKKSTLPPARVGAGKKKSAGKAKKARADKKGEKPSRNLPTAPTDAAGNNKSGDLGAQKKPAPLTKSRKRTLMGPGVLDSATSKKGAFSDAGFGKKTGAATALKPLFAKKEKPVAGTGMRDSKPDGMEKAHTGATPADSETVASTRPSKKPTRPAMTAIPDKKSPSRNVEDSERIEDSEILSLDDDSQLVLLEGEDQSGTVELDLDALGAEAGISEISDNDIFDDESDIGKKQSPADRTAHRAGKTPTQTVKTRALALANRLAAMCVGLVIWLKRATPKWASMLRRVPVKVWAIVAGAGVLLLGSGIFLMHGCDDDSMPKAEKVATVEANQSRKTNKKNKQRGVKKPTVENSPSPQAATGNCHPVSAYGEFLWHDALVSIVEKSGYKAVCDLMGQSFASMVTALADSNPVMVGSIDGLPDSAALEIVPSDTAALGAGGIRLMFHQTKLFRVTLDYGQARDIRLDMDDFAELLETDIEKHAQGEIVVYAVDDGAVRIELLQERGDEKQRELQFTALKLDDALANRLDAQRRARRFLVKANEYVRRRQYSNAADAFQSAVDANDASGGAWVGRAMAQLYLEDFSGARAAAEKALAVSDDELVHSMAAQALAVVFLRSGDLKAAIAELEKAVSHNGDNAEATQALRELKTGEYATERVAITAARMSCPEALGATLQGLLAKGNFPDTQTFFDALRKAKMDIRFEQLKRDWVSRECR